ncbi:EpsG family protein [Candidatus Saccharibacteria bacterium]|nr:EpsG family protein [Candidatus Saccharibacteria bacterium]
MLIFSLMIFMIIFAWFLLKKMDNKKAKGRKLNIKLIYCIICSIALVAIAGLRAPSNDFGDDTMYMGNFEYVQKHDFPEVYKQFKLLDTEPVFYLGTKVVSLVSTNYNVLLIVCAIPVVLAISWMIYKHSKMPMLSYLLFSCAFFYLWSLVILRQAIAMSAIVFAIEFLIKKKYWKFIIAVALAALFHRTALIFLLALPISFMPYTKKSPIIFAILSVAMIVFGGLIISNGLQLFSNMWHYSAYLTREASFGNWKQIAKYVIYAVMIVVTILISKSDDRKRDKIPIYLCMTGCLLCALAPFFAETFRLGLYFMLPVIVILPNAIAGVEDSKKKLLYSGALTAGLVVLGFATFYSMGYTSIIL